MRSTIRNGLLLAAVTLVGSSGTAQAGPEIVLQADVPFAFAANGQMMPAGKFTR